MLSRGQLALSNVAIMGLFTLGTCYVESTVLFGLWQVLHGQAFKDLASVLVQI